MAAAPPPLRGTYALSEESIRLHVNVRLEDYVYTHTLPPRACVNTFTVSQTLPALRMPTPPLHRCCSHNTTAAIVLQTKVLAKCGGEV